MDVIIYVAYQCCFYVLIVAILHAFSIYDVNKVDLCVMKKETKLLYDMCDVGDGER